MHDRGTSGRKGGRGGVGGVGKVFVMKISGNVICRDPRENCMQVSSDRFARLIDIGKFGKILHRRGGGG